MKTLLVALLFSFSLSSAAEAQETCGSIMGEGIALSSGAFRKENQYDKTKINDLTARILSMAQSTLGESITPKMTLEKNGKMILGQILKDNWSLEAEYAQDARVADSFEKNSIFRLAEISVVRPNGEKIKILKSPTTISGEAFSKDVLTNKDLTGLENEVLFETLHQVNLPLTIEGPLWQSVAKWIPHLEFFPRSTLRDLDANHLTRTKIQGIAMAKWHDTKKIVNKQSIKYLLFGILIYIYTERQNINLDFLLPDPWIQLLSLSKETKLHTEEAESLGQQISALSRSTIEKSSLFKTSNKDKYSTKMYMSLSEISKTAASLAALEKKTASKQHVYVFKKNKVSPFSLKKVSEFLNSDPEDPTLVIFHHPNMKRLWIVNAHQAIEGEGDEAKFFTFALDGNADPENYRIIKSSLPGERNLE